MKWKIYLIAVAATLIAIITVSGAAPPAGWFKAWDITETVASNAPHYMKFGGPGGQEDQTFLHTHAGAEFQGANQYAVSDLKKVYPSGGPTTTRSWQDMRATFGPEYPSATYCKGSAASGDSVIFSGDGASLTLLELAQLGTWNSSTEDNPLTVTGINPDTFVFSTDGTKLFTNSFASNRERIYRYNVSRTGGRVTALTLDTTWGAGSGFVGSTLSRVRSLELHRVAGTDYLYLGEGANTGANFRLVAMNCLTGAVSDLGANWSGTQSDITTISWVQDGDGFGQLWVLSDNRGLQVFDLNSATSLANAGNPILIVTRADLETITGFTSTTYWRSMEVTADGLFIFMTAHGQGGRLVGIRTSPPTRADDYWHLLY